MSKRDVPRRSDYISRRELEMLAQVEPLERPELHSEQREVGPDACCFAKTESVFFMDNGVEEYRLTTNPKILSIFERECRRMDFFELGIQYAIANMGYLIKRKNARHQKTT